MTPMAQADAGVRVTTLANGLRVVSDSMTSVETASIGVWVAVGSRHEPAEINGVSHVLEHMAFKGTRRRTARDIAEEVDAVGGHLDAYTSHEHTAYYAKVLNEDIALAVDIIADILQNAIMDADELARERSVIVQEINHATDTPDDIIFDRFQETAFPGQGLGRSVLGTVETVGRLPRETILSYMRARYGASRMVVAAAGRIEHDAVADLVARAFDGLASPSEMPVDAARYAGGEYRQSRELEQVHLVLGFEGVPVRDRDFYALSVFSTLFGGGMSSRLFQEVREARGLAYSVYSFLSSYSDGGLLGIYAGTSEAQARDLVPVVCDQLCTAAEQVTEAEVARARAQIKANILMSLESTTARCERLARQMLLFGRPIPMTEVVQRIEAVDVTATLAAARRLALSQPTLATIGPIGGVESLDAIVGRLA